MRKTRSKWWRTTHSALVRALYEHDPDGMGATVMSPEDEYYDLGFRLFRELSGARDTEEIRDAVLRIWPDSQEEMIDEIERIWRSAARKP